MVSSPAYQFSAGDMERLFIDCSDLDLPFCTNSQIVSVDLGWFNAVDDNTSGLSPRCKSAMLKSKSRNNRHLDFLKLS